MNHKPCITLTTLLLLWVACGSTCPRRQQEFLPYTLPPAAPLDQYLGSVNDNSAKVVSLWATQATLTAPGAPTLPVSIAVVPPLRFRMRASTALTGPEVDIGSNDDLFWFWIKRSQPAALYFCRHDQYAASAARQIMPVEPQWIVEALGLTRFSPADQPQGPFPVGAGRVQIRTIRHSAVGELTKITVLDDRRGLVLEQNLYDAAGQRIASAFTSEHHLDPVTGAILPRHIEIQYPGAQLSLRIEIADQQVNTIGAANTALWVKPQYNGFPDVDLATANSLVPPGAAMLPIQPAPAPSAAPLPSIGYPPPATSYVPPQLNRR